jgi:hypothetical protein
MSEIAFLGQRSNTPCPKRERITRKEKKGWWREGQEKSSVCTLGGGGSPSVSSRLTGLTGLFKGLRNAALAEYDALPPPPASPPSKHPVRTLKRGRGWAQPLLKTTFCQVFSRKPLAVARCEKRARVCACWTKGGERRQRVCIVPDSTAQDTALMSRTMGRERSDKKEKRHAVREHHQTK